MSYSLDVICYFCFENFEILLEPCDHLNSEIWDCEVCCNPNKIAYLIKDANLEYIEISDGND